MEILRFPYLGVRPGVSAAATSALLLVAGGLGCATRSPVRTVEEPWIERAREAHHEVRPAPRPGDAQITVGVDHVVRPGQTLWRIAKVYGVDADELARVNRIVDPGQLEVGQTLFVPGALFPKEVPPYPAPLDRAALPPPPSTPRWHDDDGAWVWPVRGGHVLSGYGAPRRSHRHRGIDIRGRAGQPVLAARGGRVVYSGSGMRGYGKTVIVDHGGGLSSLYAHNSELLVGVGDRVRGGQAIARVGRTGNATANHCHFEIRRNDRPVDPLPLLQPALEARR